MASQKNKLCFNNIWCIVLFTTFIVLGIISLVNIFPKIISIDDFNIGVMLVVVLLALTLVIGALALKDRSTKSIIDGLVKISASTFFFSFSAYFMWIIFVGNTESINLLNNSDNKHLLSNGDIIELIALLATFAGFLAYIFKTIVSQTIEAKVDRENEKNRLYTRAYSHRSVANTHYIISDITTKKRKKRLKKSLKKFRDAFRYANELYLKSEVDNDDTKTKTEYCQLLCAIENDIAWVQYELLKGKYLNNSEKKIYKNDAKKHIKRVMKYVEKFNFKQSEIEIWQDTEIKINNLS